jgi:uncharacterized membrane protein YjjB (DUF3815 family)
MKSLKYEVFHYEISSTFQSLTGPNSFLIALFPNILSHPYETKGKIIALPTLILMILGRKREGKNSEVNRTIIFQI